MDKLASLPKDPLISALTHVWRQIVELADAMPAAAWHLPTECPGWTVRDQLAHMVAAESSLLGADRPEIDVAPAPHIRNAPGMSNEAWIIALRSVPIPELVARFRAATAQRTAALQAMSQDEFDRQVPSPVGPASYGRYMLTRVYDQWMHQQDMREAAGISGSRDRAVLDFVAAEVESALGFIVGKKVGAPPGTRVTIVLTGDLDKTMHVAVSGDGRAAVVAALDRAADVTITIDAFAFLRLAGGRREPAAELASGRIVLTGDVALGERIVGALPYTM